MSIRSDKAGGEGYRGKVKGMVLDWSGTTADAYVLASLAGDLKIAEVVDLPNVLVSMHMPKSIFQ